MLGFLQNPTMTSVYMIVLAVAAMNYGFQAFDKNPIQYVLKCGGSTFEKVVMILIGLIGLHFLIQTFSLMQYASAVQDNAQMIFEQGKQYVQQAVQAVQQMVPSREVKTMDE